MEQPVAKKVTSINPIIGVLSVLDMMKDAALGKGVSGRDIALTDTIGDITVDTCIPSDTDVWETGINRESIEGKWVIVSQYDSREEAAKKHKKWVAYMKEHPKCILKDIDCWGLEEVANDRMES